MVSRSAVLLRALSPATRAAVKGDIDGYLRSGWHDPHWACWPGQSFLERELNGSRVLRAALLDEVSRRARDLKPPTLPPGVDPTTFARKKLAPMVSGLFPAAEREAVLDLAVASVVFVTAENLTKLLNNGGFLSTAWEVANLYLGSVGAPALGGDGVVAVGMSEGATCYISPAYFGCEDPFADFVVHEAAHLFHNVKRDRCGLRRTRSREWLLEIQFSKREVFAYACEAYSRLLEMAREPAARRRLLAEYQSDWVSEVERVDRAELVAILGEAVAARNGWKRILSSCAPARPHSMPTGVAVGSTRSLRDEHDD